MAFDLITVAVLLMFPVPLPFWYILMLFRLVGRMSKENVRKRLKIELNQTYIQFHRD